MFVDTIAATTVLDRELDVKLFQGGAVSEDFTTGERSARLFRNPIGVEYEPRVTWWPQSRTLKVEFSVLRMGGSLASVLDRTAAWLRTLFGDLPPIGSWKVSRIDYAVDVLAGNFLPSYMSVLQNLRIASWARVPYAQHGVVWKSQSPGGRWIKFYDKQREEKETLTVPRVIRFEVSNYRDAVRYMATSWFVCERTVAEMTRPGRAAFVLCHFWSQLGLTSEKYGQRELELTDLREKFGSRSLAGAAHALMCIREHGPSAYRDLNLISKSTYYRWLNELRDHGFLAQTGKRRALPALHLAIEKAFDLELGENLKRVFSSKSLYASKNSPKNFWRFLGPKLGFNVQSSLNSYLLERFYDWAGIRCVDGVQKSVSHGDPFAGIRLAAPGKAARVGTLGGLESSDRSVEDLDRSGSERPGAGQRSSVGAAVAGRVGGGA